MDWALNFGVSQVAGLAVYQGWALCGNAYRASEHLRVVDHPAANECQDGFCFRPVLEHGS